MVMVLGINREIPTRPDGCHGKYNFDRHRQGEEQPEKITRIPFGAPRKEQGILAPEVAQYATLCEIRSIDDVV